MENDRLPRRHMDLKEGEARDVCWKDRLTFEAGTGITAYTRGSQTVGSATLEGHCWSSGRKRVVCMRDIFILNDVGKQGKIYILAKHFPWLKYFTYQ
jgi:hypothetical protein